MSFTADFYKNDDDPKVVNKTLGNAITSATCSPYGTVDIVAPVLELDYNANVLECNYCYISDFNRYYFINDISVSPANKMIVSCSVDVLKTYSGSIGNLKACITRSESIGGPTYIIDDRLPINPVVKEFKTATFSGGFSPSYNNTDTTLLIRMV